MKKIIIFIIFCSVQISFAQNKKVAKKIYTYLKSPNSKESFRLFAESTYNNKGICIYNIIYSENKKIIKIIIYENEETTGKLISYTVFDSLGHLIDTKPKVYDSDNNVLEIHFSYNLNIVCNKNFRKNNICKKNKYGYVIYFEEHDNDDKNILYQTYKYKYEYW